MLLRITVLVFFDMKLWQKDDLVIFQNYKLLFSFFKTIHTPYQTPFSYKPLPQIKNSTDKQFNDTIYTLESQNKYNPMFIDFWKKFLGLQFYYRLKRLKFLKQKFVHFKGLHTFIIFVKFSRDYIYSRGVRLFRTLEQWLQYR